MIIDWGLRFEGKSASVSATETTCKRVYIAEADAPLTESDVINYVKTTLGIDIESDHPDIIEMPTFKLKSYDIELDDGSMTALVTFNYSDSIIGGIDYDNPLDDAPEVNWGTNSETEIFAVDIDGTPVVNSAGAQFDPLPERLVGYSSCTYTRNESISDFTTVTLAAMLGIGIVVNSDIFYLRGVEITALYARMYISNASYEQRSGIGYVRVTYQFDFRAGQPGYSSIGWRLRIDDRGNFGITGGERYDLHVNGRPINENYPLDGTGGPMANPDDAPASLGPFKPYTEMSFAPFDFA